MATTDATPEPPEGLSGEARRWFIRVQDEHAIMDAAGLLLLGSAMEAFDRMRSAQASIKTDGETTLDRFHQLKPHPLLNVERDARAAMLASLKALQLDLEPLQNGVGRPGGS